MYFCLILLKNMLLVLNKITLVVIANSFSFNGELTKHFLQLSSGRILPSTETGIDRKNCVRDTHIKLSQSFLFIKVL